MKELNLLKKALSSSDNLKSVPTDIDSNQSVSDWIRLNQSLPVLAGTLTAISRSHDRVFPQACRLAKRWLSAHGYPAILCPFEANFDGLRNRADFFQFDSNCEDLIPNDDDEAGRPSGIESDQKNNFPNCCLTEIAVELLVLYAANLTQSNQQSFAATGSALVAFLRFLDLLAQFDWENAPILVDLNEGFLG